METYYTVIVHGNVEWRGQDLERAIRMWDMTTNNRGEIVLGGIDVETHDGGMMLRKGWLLHVHADGTVYLNPSIATKETAAPVTVHTVGHSADSAWCSCGWSGPARGSSYADQETASLAASDHYTTATKEI